MAPTTIMEKTRKSIEERNINFNSQNLLNPMLSTEARIIPSTFENENLFDKNVQLFQSPPSDFQIESKLIENPNTLNIRDQYVDLMNRQKSASLKEFNPKRLGANLINQRNTIQLRNPTYNDINQINNNNLLSVEQTGIHSNLNIQELSPNYLDFSKNQINETDKSFDTNIISNQQIIEEKRHFQDHQKMDFNIKEKRTNISESNKFQDIPIHFNKILPILILIQKNQNLKL